MSNPFQSIVKGKPVAAVTDYHKDVDKYIIEYVEKEFVKVTDDSKKVNLVMMDSLLLRKSLKRQELIDKRILIHLPMMLASLIL